METYKEFLDLFQKADWKKEKHIPVIECPNKVKTDEKFDIKVSIGKEIPHPNTTEHFIGWISLLFKPENEKYPYHVGYYIFNAHGASVQGPNTSTIFTDPSITTSLKTSKPGQLIAISYCNIHGLWQSEKEIKIE